MNKTYWPPSTKLVHKQLILDYLKKEFPKLVIEFKPRPDIVARQKNQIHSWHPKSWNSLCLNGFDLELTGFTDETDDRFGSTFTFEQATAILLASHIRGLLKDRKIRHALKVFKERLVKNG